MTRQIWTPEYLDWLRKHYPTMTPAEMAPAMNEQFGISVTAKQVRSALRNHKITQGERTGRFEKGQKPWNLGKTGYMGANTTSFKSGNRPHNKRRLWTERISKDGYIAVSVPERNPYTGHPTRFKHKHVWLWEAANGPKPKGTAVIFKDGDNRNFDQGNLLLVGRTELLAMNLHDYKGQPKELKPSVLALARVEAKAGIRTRPGRGRQRG